MWWGGRWVCTIAVQAEGDDGEDELDGAKWKVDVKHRGVLCTVVF